MTGKTTEGRVTTDERPETTRSQLDREPSQESPEVLNEARLAEEARVELSGSRFYVGPERAEDFHAGISRAAADHPLGVATPPSRDDAR